MARRYSKEDVEFHSDRFTDRLPAVNVKVYFSVWDIKLPLELGSYSDDKGVTWKTSYTDEGFNHEWIEANVSEDWHWFHWACEDGWEQLQELAEEIFGASYYGSKVEVQSQGRSSGWAVIPALPEFETWDAVFLAKWRKFERQAKAVAADVPRVMLDSVYANAYLPQREENTGWTIGNLKPSGSGVIERSVTA